MSEPNLDLVRPGDSATRAEQNVSLVKRVYSAHRGGEMDAIFSLYDADIEWETLPQAPGDRIYHGHDGIRTFFRAWLGAWSEWDLDVEEVTPVGDARVLTVFRQHGRLRRTGVEVENRTAQIWTIRDGKVIRVQDFPSREEALAAAGL
jgi:ketosteroid isomerase-like protein